MQVTMQNAVQVNAFCNVHVLYNTCLRKLFYPEADETLETLE